MFSISENYAPTAGDHLRVWRSARITYALLALHRNITKQNITDTMSPACSHAFGVIFLRLYLCISGFSW